MGLGNELSKPRAIRVKEEQTHPCRQCPIKAQVAARVGPAGTSLNFAKKRALERLDPAAWKWGFCALHPSLRMLSGLIYLDAR